MFSINPDRLSFRGLSGVSRGINSPSIFDTPPGNLVMPKDDDKRNWVQDLPGPDKKYY